VLVRLEDLRTIRKTFAEIRCDAERAADIAARNVARKREDSGWSDGDRHSGHGGAQVEKPWTERMRLLSYVRWLVLSTRLSARPEVRRILGGRNTGNSGVRSMTKTIRQVWAQRLRGSPAQARWLVMRQEQSGEPQRVHAPVGQEQVTVRVDVAEVAERCNGPPEPSPAAMVLRPVPT
jgi:hypothetical protein